MWGANTFPVRKYNSRTFSLKVCRPSLFRFFRRFPQINVGGDSARIPFLEDASVSHASPSCRRVGCDIPKPTHLALSGSRSIASLKGHSKSLSMFFSNQIKFYKHFNQTQKVTIIFFFIYLLICPMKSKIIFRKMFDYSYNPN